MKVLTIACINPTKIGSFERYCEELTKELRQKGHKHRIVFSGEPSQKVHELLLNAGAKLQVRDFGKLGFTDSLSLCKLAKTVDADLVHVHFYPPLSFFSFFNLFSKRRYYATYHISGLICRLSPIKKLVKKLVFGIAFGKGVQKIFCVSKYNQNKLLVDYQISENKTALIYNSVAVDLFDMSFNHREIKKDDTTKIICIAALIPEKGVQIAVKAVKQLTSEGSDVSLDIVGQGPYMGELRSLVDELKLEKRVGFLGSRDDIPRLLQEYDISLVPSLWQEAFGYTTIEAMAAGVPVIASNVGGIPEIIEDGINGLLFTAGNVDGLKNKIRELINKPELVERLRPIARNTVIERFNLQKSISLQVSQYH